jgi:hypothetical protein
VTLARAKNISQVSWGKIKYVLQMKTFNVEDYMWFKKKFLPFCHDC